MIGKSTVFNSDGQIIIIQIIFQLYTMMLIPFQNGIYHQ